MRMPKNTLCVVDFNECTDLIFTNNIGEQFFICLLADPIRKNNYGHVVAWQADVADLECYDPIGEPIWLGADINDVYNWKNGEDESLLEICKEKLNK